jgi:hypothetical protein
MPVKQVIPVTSATSPMKDIQHYMRPGTLHLPVLPPLSLYVHLPWCLKQMPLLRFQLPRVPCQAAQRASFQSSAISTPWSPTWRPACR